MINGSLERGTFHGKPLDVSVVETVTQTYGAALLNPLCPGENISLADEAAASFHTQTTGHHSFELLIFY